SLHVQPEKDDRPELPPHVFGIERVRPGIVGLSRERQRFLTETLVGGGEKQTFVREALEWIGIRYGARAVAAPAVGPVVVPGHPDERMLEGVEVRNGRRIQAVGTWTVATRFQVAVEHRKRNVAGIDVREQRRILRLAQRVVRHVPEEADRIFLTAASV